MPKPSADFVRQCAFKSQALSAVECCLPWPSAVGLFRQPPLALDGRSLFGRLLREDVVLGSESFARRADRRPAQRLVILQSDATASVSPARACSSRARSLVAKGSAAMKEAAVIDGRRSAV